MTKYRSKKSEAKSIFALARLAQGATVQQIAKELDLSESSVYVRIRRESDEWLKKMGNVIAQVKIMQTQQLHYIYGQAIETWKISAAVDEATGLPTKEGDARYLETAMKSLGEVRKIWNADQPIEWTEEGDAIVSTAKEGLTVNQVGEVLQVLESINALPAGMDLEKIQAHVIPSEATYAEFVEEYTDEDTD